MLSIQRHVALAAALVIAGVVGACGSSTPPPDTANDKKPDTTQTGDTGGTDTANAGGTNTDAAKPDATTDAGKPDAPPAAAAKPSTPIQASKMLADIKKIGLNPAKLPAELAKIPMSQKKKLMPLFQKSLGYENCQGCHVKDDFKAETRNIKVTRGMWTHFVAELRDEKGGAVFCDTCHDGTAKNLNRSDRKAMEKFMEDEYEGKLTRADKKDNECTSCHSDTMEMKIIEKVWGIAAK